MDEPVATVPPSAVADTDAPPVTGTLIHDIVHVALLTYVYVI